MRTGCICDDIKMDNEINTKKLCGPDASGSEQALVSGCFGHRMTKICVFL